MAHAMGYILVPLRGSNVTWTDLCRYAARRLKPFQSSSCVARLKPGASTMAEAFGLALRERMLSRGMNNSEWKEGKIIGELKVAPFSNHKD